jgi:hypothetical protein
MGAVSSGRMSERARDRDRTSKFFVDLQVIETAVERSRTSDNR